MRPRDKIHFVRSTQIPASDVLVVDGRMLWSEPATLFRRIEALCGAGTADLFAEPTVKAQQGQLAVAWFAGWDEEARALDSLDRARRARVEANLSAKLAALRPALADPAFGPTVAAMLNLAGDDAIFALGDEAVLVNWGALPLSARESPAAFTRHSEQTLARFLPAGTSPAIPGKPWSIADGTSPAGLSPMRRMAPEGSAQTTADSGAGPDAGTPVRAGGSRLWLWSLAVPLLFLAFLLWAWLSGNLIYPEVAEPEAPPPLIDSAAIDESLEERIAMLRRELARGCEADPSTLGALSLPPSPDSAEAPATALPTPAMPGAAVPRSGLLASLDQATVLVLAPSASGDSLSTGSGFFISPLEVLTNRHVISDAGQVIWLANQALGKVVRARVMAQSSGNRPGQPDFALLRLEEPASQIVPLRLSTAIGRLEGVVAAGFPSDIMSNDSSYQALVAGDASGLSSLEMVVSQGNVMAMPRAGGASLITHSASISPGNSGGPLVDACGRAVGVNTFIMVTDSSEKLNFALGAGDALSFLAQNGITVSAEDAPCVPGTPPAETPDPAAPEAAVPEAAPSP